MTDQDTSLTFSGGDLGAPGEEEWQRLRQQLELAEGFWLGFVFVPSPRQAADLRSRTEQLLRTHAHSTKVVRPESPDALRSALSDVFARDSADAGCVWIECVRSDPPPSDGTVGPWTSAWDSLLLRANEQREAIRRQLSGGLIFVAPPEIKPRVRDAAPDLWSLRSIVLEIAPTPLRRAEGGLTVELEQPRTHTEAIPGSAPDPEFALAEADRRASHAHANPRSVALALLQAVEGRLAEGGSRDAIEIARRAVRLLEEKTPNDRSTYAAAVSALSRAEQEDGDLIAALQHTETELRIRRQAADDVRSSPKAPRSLSLALKRLGDLHLQIGKSAEARSAYEQALQIDRKSLKAYGESPQTLRDLSISLDRVGDVHLQAGELAEARAAYEESLEIARRLLKAYGESPQTLRDLFISLNRVGDVHLQAGELAEARAVYEESLEIARRLLKAYGDSPQTLRDLYISLINVGDARQQADELAEARAVYEESLEIARRLLKAYGDSPQALRDLSVSLERVGDVRRQAGELAAARAAYEESLEIARRLLKAHGASPQALNDLGTVLRRVAGIRRESGDETGAKELYDELEKLRAKSSGASPRQ